MTFFDPNAALRLAIGIAWLAAFGAWLALLFLEAAAA